MLARDQAENTVAQEFEALVVNATGILPVRPVRERTLEAFGMLEAMAENRFQFPALFRGHGGIAFSSYFDGAACFLAASALCLQRS